MAKKQWKQKNNRDAFKKEDIVLFTILRKNGRMSLTNISKETRIPVSTVYERLRQFSGGIIKRYTVLLDFVKLGYSTRMSLLLRVRGEHKQELLKFLLCHHNVNNAYHINNGFDICCDAFFRDMYEAEAFIKRLEDEYRVSKVQQFYILEEIKREGFFVQPKLCTA